MAVDLSGCSAAKRMVSRIPVVPRRRSREPDKDDADEVLDERLDHPTIVGHRECCNLLQNMPPGPGWRDAAGHDRYTDCWGDGGLENRADAP